MKKCILLILLLAPVGAIRGQVPRGATVYVEPMEGYETALIAAMMKKQIPLVIVANRAEARLIVTGKIEHKHSTDPAQPTVVINNTNINNNGVDSENPLQRQAQASRGRMKDYDAAIRAMGLTQVSMSITDTQNSRIVFADTEEAGGKKQVEKTAENFVKHLRGVIG